MRGISCPRSALEQQIKATDYSSEIPYHDSLAAREQHKQLNRPEEENNPLSACDHPVMTKENIVSTVIAKQTKQTQPLASIPGQLPLRRPLQQLSLNCPASTVVAPAKHLQPTAPSHQQQQSTTHLPSASKPGRSPCLKGPAVTSPATRNRSKQLAVPQSLNTTQLLTCSSANNGLMNPDAIQQQTTMQQHQDQQEDQWIAATSADDVAAVTYPILQRHVNWPKPSRQTSDRFAHLPAHDDREGSPEDAALVTSSIDTWSAAEASSAAVRAAIAASALQHLHSHHPVTQIIQQKLSAQLLSSTTASASAETFPGTSEPPQVFQSTRRRTDDETTFLSRTSLAHVIDCTAGFGAVSSRSSAGACVTSAVAQHTAAPRNADREQEILQVLGAVRSKLQVLDAMRPVHGRLSTTDAVVPPPHAARQPITATAATHQGYAVHTAIPCSSRQQSKPSNLQRGQEELQLPSAAATGSGCSSLMPTFKAGLLPRSGCSMPAGGSVLNATAAAPRHTFNTHVPSARSLRALQPTAALAGSIAPSNALQSVNKAADLAASALAAGAIKHTTGHAEPTVCGELHVHDKSSMPRVQSSSCQDSWKLYRPVAGATLPSQTRPGNPAAAGKTAPQQASIEPPKLQAKAMPQFLQQHVAKAKRAAVALETMRHQAPTKQLDKGDMTSSSSTRASCDSSSKLHPPGSVLQHSNPATDVTSSTTASQQHQQHKTATIGHSSVGHGHVAAPLHDGLVKRQLAGTAAAAVAQQQRAYAARVLQQYELRLHARQQNDPAAETTGKPSAARLRIPGLGVQPTATLPEADVTPAASPAAAATKRSAQQGIAFETKTDFQDEDELATATHTSHSSCSCSEDTAASRLSYGLAPHMLKRTPYVGLGSEAYWAKDFDYVEDARLRYHGQPFSQDALHVRRLRHECVSFQQGAKKRLLWACNDQLADAVAVTCVTSPK